MLWHHIIREKYARESLIRTNNQVLRLLPSMSALMVNVSYG